MNIVQEIKNFVENECKKPSSKYGYEPFPFHFVPMVNYAEKLSDELGGDKEVILIAAWLHDIGSIIHDREDHHITGAKIAEEKLKEIQYPAEKIELVKKCILNHRGSQQNGRSSIEEQIITEADVMSNFDNISGIFNAAFVYENKTQGEAKESIIRKINIGPSLRNGKVKPFKGRKDNPHKPSYLTEYLRPQYEKITYNSII